MVTPDDAEWLRDVRHTAPPIRIYDRHNNRTQIVEPQ